MPKLDAQRRLDRLANNILTTAPAGAAVQAAGLPQSGIFVPFVTPPAMPTYFSAAVAGVWLQNVLAWLWPQATKWWDAFTGVTAALNNTIADVEYDIYRGWFRYQGVFTSALLGSFAANTTGILKLYVQNDSGEQTVGTYTNSLPTFPLTLPGVSGDYTLNKHYRVRVTLQRNGNPSNSARVDYLAIATQQPYSWTAPDAFTDGTHGTWGPVPTNQQYLNALIGPYGSGARVGFNPQGGLTVVYYNGSVYFRGGTAGSQTAVTVTYRDDNGGPVLRVYDAGGTLRDSLSLGSASSETTLTVLLTYAYTANTFLRVTVESSANSGTAYVKSLTIGGALALQHTPQPYSQGDIVKGTTGLQRMAWLGNENLSDIKALLRGATTTGFQYLTPDLTITDPLSIYTLGAGCAQLATMRYLYYLPVSGVSGSLSYNEKSGASAVSLADNNHADWCSYDLQTIADLAVGATLSLSGVIAAYQSAT